MRPPLRKPKPNTPLLRAHVGSLRNGSGEPSHFVNSALCCAAAWSQADTQETVTLQPLPYCLIETTLKIRN